MSPFSGTSSPSRRDSQRQHPRDGGSLVLGHRFKDQDRRKSWISGGDYDPRHVKRRDLHESNVFIFLNIVSDPAEQPVERVEIVRIDASDYRECVLSH